MVNGSLNQLTQLIAQQMDSQELLGENLTKANLLTEIILERKLLNYPPVVFLPYFWAVHDYLSIAMELHETATCDLTRLMSKALAEKHYEC